MSPRLRLRPLTLLLCCCVLSACDGGAPAEQPVRSEAGSDLGLPPCGKPPSEDPTQPPAGAVLPPTARLTAVRRQPPVIQLNGYVESTPLGVREWIESQPDLEIVMATNEHNQTEVLVTDGTSRTYVKARAVCAEGSLLSEVISAENSDAVLPTPAGSPAP